MALSIYNFSLLNKLELIKLFSVFGQMAERLKATDCKSVLSRVRRFEPCSAHSSLQFEVDNLSILNKMRNCGSSSFGRAIAFQAIGGEFEPRLPLFFSLEFTVCGLQAKNSQLSMPL